MRRRDGCNLNVILRHVGAFGNKLVRFGNGLKPGGKAGEVIDFPHLLLDEHAEEGATSLA
ncbi:hypothetical protein EMIT0P253_20267 [Pseudomonas sp. IT-P253]